MVNQQTVHSTPRQDALAPVSADTSAQTSAPRLEFIDGLRGLAMLMVVFFHSYAFGGQWQIAVPLPNRTVNIGSLFSAGSTGVSLFLVLSGFCLYWPLARTRHKAAHERRELTLWEFARKRSRRIMPPYYIALLLCCLLQIVVNAVAAHNGTRPTDSAGVPALPTSVLLHVFMLHNVRPEYFYDINGSFWSLALEFHLYLLFPILVEAFRRFPVRAIVIGVFCAAAALRFVALQAGGMEANEWVGVLTYSVFGRCFEFVLGMFAAVKVGDALYSNNGSRRPVSLKDVAAGILLLGIAVVGWKLGYGEVFKASLTGLIFASLLIAASCPKTLLHKLLSLRGIVVLGTISYSVYLVHHPFVTLMGQYGAEHHFTNVQNILFMWLFTIPAALLLGAAYHICFERPFMGSAVKTDKKPLLDGSRRAGNAPIGAARPVLSAESPQAGISKEAA